MLLAVNAGNSIISFGFFDDGCDMRASFDISSDIRKTSDEYIFTIKTIAESKGICAEDIDGAIISSVVPQLTEKLKRSVEVFIGKEPMVVGPGVKTGFHIKIDNPSELGADMVANTAAAIYQKKGSPLIIADIGAVNTVSAISKSGEYLGCAIFPGVQLSFDALHSEAAQLPNVNLALSSRAIGKNSQGAVRSGVILGSSLALDGFVARFANEMKTAREEIELVATGQYAPVVLPYCKNQFAYEEHLTLMGLYYIYNTNL
jgi:type III pantothenate kinase